MGTPAQSLITSAGTQSAPSGIAFVQKSSVGAFNLSLVATATRTGVTAGNGLICVIGHYAYDSASPTFTITDSQGNTFTQDALSAPAARQAIIASSLNVGAGTHTVTVTASAGNPANSVGAIQLLEFSGISALDQIAIAAATSTSPATGDTPALAITGELAIAAFATDSTGSGYTSPPTGGPGTYTNTASGVLDTVFNGDFDYQLNVGTDAVSAAWGSITAAPWAAALATYKPEGATPPSKPLYPRLANFMANGAETTTPNIHYCQHLDAAMVTQNFEGAAADGGWNRGTGIVDPVQGGDGTIVPKVLNYQLDSYFTPPNGNSAPIWSGQMNAMANYWFLWNPNVSANFHVVTADQNNPWATNPVDQGGAGRDANGNAMEGAFAAYTYGYYVTGATADAAPNLSGMWHDNVFSTFGGYLPYNPPTAYGAANFLGGGPTSGAVYNSNDATANAATRAGIAEFFTWYRKNAPGQFLMGNLSVIGTLSDAPSTPIFQRPLSVIGALNGALDAAMVESAFGATMSGIQDSTEHFQGFEVVRQLIQYVDSAVKHPEFNQYNHYGLDVNGCDADLPNGSVGPGSGGVNGTPGQAARYSFCGSLCIANGCHAVLNSATLSGGPGFDTPGGWYDYYSVDPATLVAINYATATVSQVGAGRRWLGAPMDAVQTAPTQGKAYARRFTMASGRIALVLCNPSSNSNSGAAPVTLNSAALAALSPSSSSSWTHITASSGNNGANSSIDSGATVTSVTIPVGDGVILVQ